MTEAPKAKKIRGKPVPLPAWWLAELQLEWKRMKGEGWTEEKLADALTKRVDRRLDGEVFGWDRKTVKRFIQGENPTQDLVDAFCALAPTVLIPPVFVALARSRSRRRCGVRIPYGRDSP